MDKIPVKKFKMNDIDHNIVIVGPRGSGMSWMTQDILRRKKKSCVKIYDDD